MVRELVNTKQAARRCGLSPRTMEKRRCASLPPAWVRLGRAVRYDVAELDAWIAKSRRTSTSDAGPEDR